MAGSRVPVTYLDVYPLLRSSVHIVSIVSNCVEYYDIIVAQTDVIAEESFHNLADQSIRYYPSEDKMKYETD